MANQSVADDVNKVALQRGPLVYCVESPDVKDGHVVNLVLPDDAPRHRRISFRPVERGGDFEERRLGFALRRWARKIGKSESGYRCDPLLRMGQPRPRRNGPFGLRAMTRRRVHCHFPTIASTSKATASSDQGRQAGRPSSE